MERNLGHSARSRSNHDRHRSSNGNACDYTHQNRYSYLNSDVTEHEVVNSSNNKKVVKSSGDGGKSTESKQRIPPIKVTNKKISEIRSEVMKIPEIKIVQDMFHPTQYGNYIYAQSVKDYKVIRKFCDDNNYQYVTHPLNDEIIERFCLYGLEQMSHDALQKELYNKEIKPVRVTEIPIRQKRYSEHCIYVLHFMRKQKVQLRDLHQITGLFNTRIRFAPFDDPNKFEPKQCKRCQDYNHGERGCTQDYKCRRCAGKHPTSECEHLPEIECEDYMDDGVTKQKVKDIKAKIDDKYIKCVNCGGPHTANYKGCSKRQEMVKLRDALRNKWTKTRQPVPNFSDTEQFRPLPKVGRPIGNNSWQQSYSSQLYPRDHELSRRPPPFQEDHRHDDNDVHHDSHLFNADECKHIMNRFMSKLSSCRSKQDQIVIIGELTFEFLWKRP